MPKRKMRTAAQLAASRRNLEKARKAKAGKTIPRSEYGGKMLTLYHRTTPLAASRININGFRSKIGKGTERYKYGEPKVFGSNRIRGQAEGYGKAIVSFRVNRKFAALDDQFPSGERHYAVEPTQIKKSAIRVISGRKLKK